MPLPRSSFAAADARVPAAEDRLAQRQRPAEPVIGRQRWNRLLFGHWAVEPAAIQATLPPGLYVDTFEGTAYVGVVPFRMERVRPAGLPPVPWLSWFLELNVRTYVHDAAGRPGVWFYSLDCNQPIAVALARTFFHLPYEHAAMRCERGPDESWDYTCTRRGVGGAAARFAWRAGGPAAPAAPGTLEFFLVERYLLFAADARGGLHAGRVHHEPYRISRPEVTAWSAGPVAQAGLAVAGPPVSWLAAEAVDVSIFPLRRMSAT
jgi:uncharacterized protein YqjF (DUF2071 family)